MSFAILCPNLLFIEDKEWAVAEKREQFTNSFSQLVNFIIDKKIEIYWNDILENLLWCEPNLQPWVTPCTESILFELRKHTKLIPNSCGFSECSCTPDIITTIHSKNVTSPVLSLFHYVIGSDINDENILFIVDEINNHKFTFSCNCHKKTLNPITTLPLEIIDKKTIREKIELNWNKIDNDEILYDLLCMIKSLYFSPKDFQYTTEYDASFFNSLKKTTDDKFTILYDITRRLILSPSEVSKIASFHDELIQGSKIDKRSFRVNKECRIYYKYNDKGSIRFIDYTGSGEHDKGTRHT